MEIQIVTCPSCGAQMQVNNDYKVSFCGKCGCKMIQEPRREVAHKNTGQSGMPIIENELQLADYHDRCEASGTKSNLKNTNKTNKWKVVAICSSLVAVLLACLLVLQILGINIFHKSQSTELSSCSGFISAGTTHTVGLREDGTVVATGDNSAGQCNVDDWRNIVAVSAGWRHTVGLHKDGTVIATVFTGDSNDNFGQCDVSDWKGIIAISAGDEHTVGLRKDGTVIATEFRNEHDAFLYSHQCDVDSWTDIVAIDAGSYHTVGLRKDGTVVATGDNYYGECDVSDWKNIIAVAADSEYTVGLRSDGTVVATGKIVGSQYSEGDEYNVDEWTDIIAIAAGGDHTVGLRKDGTVVTTGSNYAGQRNVEEWTDIVAISAGLYHTVGLRKDGTVVATECNIPGWLTDYNDYEGQCDVSAWVHMKVPG